ncbi:MAG: four helix bundle protein [Candidatus Omnitrophica bacterium]|nr:four helix bundle protein [Candidatus Omnitrophota bacterium]
MRYQIPVTSYQKKPDTRGQKIEGKDYQFDFENLKVYQKALGYIDRIFILLKALPTEYRYSIGDNLLRAAMSISNNIAEGNDKVSRKERTRYFRTSSDSTRECVSVMNVLMRQQLIDHEAYVTLRNDAREITSMLRALIL